MNIRVSGQTLVNNTLADIRRQTTLLSKYQDQASSGVRVKLPSDDAIQYPALARARTASARYETYTATIADTTNSLNAGVDALGEANKVLTRAKQVAIEGANATTDPRSYEALAAEVDGLLDRLVAAGNTRVDGSYLFGGTATTTPPFRVASLDAQGRPSAVAYDGTGDRGETLVGEDHTVATRYAGDQVFQRSGADAFAQLIALRDDLLSTAGGNKPATLSRRIAGVDAAREAVADTTAEQASDLAGLDALSVRVKDLKLTADTRVEEIQTADYADAAVKLQQQQTALQVTLAVAARLSQPSLLDFIR